MPMVPVPRTTDLHVIDPAQGFTAWHNAVNSEPPSSRSPNPSLPAELRKQRRSAFEAFPMFLIASLAAGTFALASSFSLIAMWAD